MSDAYTDIWTPFILIALCYLAGRLLISWGVLRTSNLDSVARLMSLVVGISYAASFDTVRSFGAFDFIIQIGAGVMVGGITWIFVVMGLGSALPIDFKKSASAPEQLEAHKGEAP